MIGHGVNPLTMLPHSDPGVFQIRESPYMPEYLTSSCIVAQWYISQSQVPNSNGTSMEAAAAARSPIITEYSGTLDPIPPGMEVSRV